jgi:beta-galactosidase/beta-glucuronidase
MLILEQVKGMTRKDSNRGKGKDGMKLEGGVASCLDSKLGEKIGAHEGAYTRFAFDVTNRLRMKGDNYLAVRVTSPWKVPGRSHYEFMKGEFEEWWDALPRTGQVVFPLGLHRGVRLEITSAARIEELQVSTTRLRDLAEAPMSSPAQADLMLRLTVSNAGPLRHGTLQLSIRPENFAGPALICRFGQLLSAASLVNHKPST